MSDCIFEKIINKEIPAEIVFENEKVLAFKDIMPQAKIHLLFIHKEKTLNINDMSLNKSEQLQELFNAIRIYTEKEKLDETGFRVVTNLGRDGGQTVFYTHLHVLGGEQLGKFGK
jgi:histidine triad (HIT) family protein